EQRFLLIRCFISRVTEEELTAGLKVWTRKQQVFCCASLSVNVSSALSPGTSSFHRRSGTFCFVGTEDVAE
ncbi:hypothetical protein XENOCAPTIV_020415, partial [Xenoophorus captivus]